MDLNIHTYTNIFFVGIAGTGMSAIAQYLQGIGKSISGSDRLFSDTEKKETQLQLEYQGIKCFFQDARGITQQTQLLVISTAIEESNIEYQKAKALGIPIAMRSDVLAAISNSVRTIAVGGTSGKSTTTAMIFHVLDYCGYRPSLITGAGLSSLQKKGLIGNAWVGQSKWLVIESDESDGSIIKYKPEIGVLLNIDRDHKEYDELMDLFTAFKRNTQQIFIVNADDKRTALLSSALSNEFSSKKNNAGYYANNFKQAGYFIEFECNGEPFIIPAIGKHNMENALACIAVCNKIGIPIAHIAKAMHNFEGIYRRTQLIGEKNGITIIDDFAHNPAEVVAAIKACQIIGKRVLAWFQPHGYGPLRFMYQELADQVHETLRNEDIFYLSAVYYAGGTVSKDIESNVVSEFIAKKGKKSLYFADRNDVKKHMCNMANQGDVILLMGARDVTMANFAKEVLASM